jgi:hypothetical protein
MVIKKAAPFTFRVTNQPFDNHAYRSLRPLLASHPTPTSTAKYQIRIEYP